MKRVLIALALTSCTHPQRVVALSTVSTSFIIADWHQTDTWIVPHCRELNPVIGPCGERMPVNTYFPLAIAAHMAVGFALPERWREIWFAGVVGVQIKTVLTNVRLK